MADKAIARARELDEYYRQTGKLIGPLVSRVRRLTGNGANDVAWRPDQRQGACWVQRPDLQCRVCGMV